MLKPSDTVKLHNTIFLLSFTTLLHIHLNHKKLFIQGITSSGKPFRPSDWVERLCGVMASFRPLGDTGDPRFCYSPYVTPALFANVKCVAIDTRLADLDPRALDFVMNFAKDNDLVIQEITE